MKMQTNIFFNFKIIIFASIISLFSIFVFFRMDQVKDSDKIKKAVQTILRNEIAVANSYAMSKSLADLQAAGFFECARLIEKTNEYKRVYFDTFLSGKCENSPFGYLIKDEYKGMNGLVYNFNFYKNKDQKVIILEVVLYLLIILTTYVLVNSVKQYKEFNKSKIDLLELEKKNFQSINKQVTHDVASPLSSLKMMMGLLHNIDPEVKAILIKSIDRTYEIFNSLAYTEEAIESVDFSEVVDLIWQIINEKKISHKNIKFEFVFDSTISKRVVISKMSFQRILSNVLNNSIDSILSCASNGVIEINIYSSSINVPGDYLIFKVIDNGAGIPNDIIAKIGERGFSYGKKSDKFSGAGLGLHDAIQKIKNWGGLLYIYNNKLSRGATVEMNLVAHNK